MNQDCGLTDPDYRSNWTYIELVQGWPRRMLPGSVRAELGALLNTPGVPFHWVAHVFRWSRFWQDRARVMIGAAGFIGPGKANALSITEDDARRMLALTRSGYRGEVPEAIRMVLAVDCRSATVIAAELGRSAISVRRWRNAS